MLSCLFCSLFIVAVFDRFMSSAAIVLQPSSLALNFPAIPRFICSRNPSSICRRSKYLLSPRRLIGDSSLSGDDVYCKRCCDRALSPSMVIASHDEASAGDRLSRYPVDSAAASKLVRHGITKQGWEALVSLGEESTLRESELLMFQGDQPKDAGDREVYLLLSGECRLEVRGSEVARLVPGDFVGEGSFTSGMSGPRSSTVRAKGEKGAEVLAWPTSRLRSFMAEPTNALVTVALQACWMSGLARKLDDVMSALAGEPSPDIKGDDEVEVGDYGFRYPEDTREVKTVVPVTSFRLALWNFAREYRSLRRTFRFGQFKDTWIAGPFSLIDRFLETSIFPELRPSRVDLPRDPAVQELQQRLGELQLSNEAIWQREKSRIASTRELLEKQTRQGLVQASILLRSQTPWYVMLPYKFLCWGLDVIYEDRPIQRFWFLETVARMPYFSYLSSLHFLETLGWWTGGAEVRRVHFAEEYNEMQHLRIMESLGGDVLWSDRFLARHVAIVYFWILTLGYFVSPFLAYNFSELIESHAVDTYSEFLEVNKEALKGLPPSPQALQYYRSGDMFLFDEFQTSRPAFSRRPVIKNLYDVFIAIRDDELEHVKTMFACERGTGDLISPNLAAATPRWAEDAPSMPSSSQAVASGEFTALRSDIRRNTPLDVYLAGRNLIDRGGRKKGKRKKQAGTRDSSSAHVADDHDGVPGAEAEDREGPSGVQAELDGGKAEGQEEMGK